MVQHPADHGLLNFWVPHQSKRKRRLSSFAPRIPKCQNGGRVYKLPGGERSLNQDLLNLYTSIIVFLPKNKKRYFDKKSSSLRSLQVCPFLTGFLPRFSFDPRDLEF